MGVDKRANSNVKLGQSTKLITVYREMPNLSRPCSCENLSTRKSFVDYLLEYKAQRGGILNLVSAVKAYEPNGLHTMTGWDELEVSVNISNEQQPGRDPNWVNVEDNSDLNTSNESYISSSSDDDDD